MLGNSKPKSQPKSYIDQSERIEVESRYDYTQNPVDLGRAFATSLKKDVGQGLAQEFGRQLTGFMQPGQEISFGGKKADRVMPTEQVRKIDIAAGIDYHRDIVKGSERIHKQIEQGITQKMEDIRKELTAIMHQVQELSQRSEFASIAVEQAPEKIGKYYDTFFSWLLITIRNLRMQIEDSGNWLQAVDGKKKKLNYWGMFKKHGTSFSLNGERSSSNSVA